MNLPNNTKLPFFAYGLFKPGQLCFFRIKDWVKNSFDAEVSGILKERDGIPLLILSNYSKVKGVLIQFKEEHELNAYKRIVEIEPDEVYKWQEVQLTDGTKANALLGRRYDRGSADLEHAEEWDGRTDPFFKDAVEEIEAILKNNSEFRCCFKTILRLQMAYSLLWTALERYAGLRYYLGKKDTTKKKVYQIAKEEVFAKSLKKHVRTPRDIYCTSDLEKYTLDPDDPDKSIKYYYQVRSNAVHRGKAIDRDFDILKNSLEELLGIFKDMLNEVWGYTKR
jgi:hypothetical protein